MTELACPTCGETTLHSDESASIMYPVTLRRDEAGRVVPEYTGDHYLVMDEDTRYEHDLWCRSCGNAVPEESLVPVARDADG